MGPGIAQIFAVAGYDVSIWTRGEETRDRAMVVLRKSLQTFVDEGLLDADKLDATYDRIKFVLTVEDTVKGADFIQETIIENKEAKTVLYKTLSEIVPKDVIIASNTSGLNVFDLVPESLLPQMVIAHWYAPAMLIPLVEVVKSEQAPQEFADVTVALLEKSGKTAVLMKKFIQGYIANRLQMCLNTELFFLLDNGYCTPEDIDKACKASFIPRAVVLGLCKRADFGGLDMTANNYKNKSYIPPEPVDMPRTLAEHIEKGELGLKTGKGFYDYTGVERATILAKRDAQLFEVFKLANKFMADPV
jgi:3-hydroxybutyryl-CoA dehydrogenase